MRHPNLPRNHQRDRLPCSNEDAKGQSGSRAGAQSYGPQRSPGFRTSQHDTGVALEEHGIRPAVRDDRFRSMTSGRPHTPSMWALRASPSVCRFPKADAMHQLPRIHHESQGIDRPGVRAGGDLAWAGERGLRLFSFEVALEAVPGSSRSTGEARRVPLCAWRGRFEFATQGVGTPSASSRRGSSRLVGTSLGTSGRSGARLREWGHPRLSATRDHGFGRATIARGSAVIC